MNPGRVSSAERVPPPTSSAASYMRTDRPARASSIAAASPLGPAPTTIASSLLMASPGPGRRTSAGRAAAAYPASGGGDGADRHVDGGAVADVARVLPLPAAIDAHPL